MAEAVPAELLQVLADGGGTNAAAGATPAAAAAGENLAPAAGPMTTPQRKEGLTQAAMVKISMTTKLLSQALDAFGALTPEGKAINQALGILIKKFGAEEQKADALIPAEIIQLMQSVPGAGAGKAMAGMPPGQTAMPG